MLGAENPPGRSGCLRVRAASHPQRRAVQIASWHRMVVLELHASEQHNPVLRGHGADLLRSELGLQSTRSRPCPQPCPELSNSDSALTALSRVQPPVAKPNALQAAPFFRRSWVRSPAAALRITRSYRGSGGEPQGAHTLARAGLRPLRSTISGTRWTRMIANGYPPGSASGWVMPTSRPRCSTSTTPRARRTLAGGGGVRASGGR